MNNKDKYCLKNISDPFSSYHYYYCECQHCVSFRIHNAGYLNQLQNDTWGQYQHGVPYYTPIHTGYPSSTVAEKIDFLKNEIKKLEQENV